jgi:hypothetical protein
MVDSEPSIQNSNANPNGIHAWLIVKPGFKIIMQISGVHAWLILSPVFKIPMQIYGMRAWLILKPVFKFLVVTISCKSVTDGKPGDFKPGEI